jgi:hypothetical protein
MKKDRLKVTILVEAFENLGRLYVYISSSSPLPRW